MYFLTHQCASNSTLMLLCDTRIKVLVQHAQVQDETCVIVTGQENKQIKHAEQRTAEGKVRRTVPWIIVQTEVPGYATKKTGGYGVFSEHKGSVRLGV